MDYLECAQGVEEKFIKYTSKGASGRMRVTCKMSKARVKPESIKHLQALRNIGPATAMRLYSIGIKSPEQLKKSNPEELYEELKEKEGGKLDRCVLYLLQGAVLDIPWPECKNLTNCPNTHRHYTDLCYSGTRTSYR